MTYLVLFICLWIALLFYFRIADHYNIIDHPNERSSHADITIRGGGILFPLVNLLIIVLYPVYWLPALGGLLIGTISFIDDRITLSNKIRIVIHIVSVTLMFIFLDVFKLPFYLFIVLYIIAIGVINVYNFMDGINGITGCYTLIVLAGLQYVNLNSVNFIHPDLIWFPMLACIVFLFYNFRKQAKCFAGDVGSITIAFWIVFLLFQLIFINHNWSYILFLAVYGVDSVLTIAHRLILKQNIFKAHRLHFYQLLANEHKVSHLVIAAGYALIQMLVIAFVVLNTRFSQLEVFMIVLLPLMFVYLIFKPRLMKVLR